MRKFFYTLFIILIAFQTAQAAYYSSQGNEKTATFISQYTSRSMDPQTLDYYQQIKDNYNIHIIKDTWVADNSQEWRNAYQNSDLIFVVSLSDEVLNQRRYYFCNNLAEVLESSVGLIFAGNSVLYNNESYGCLYTPKFNFSNPANNSQIIQNEIKIIELDESTGDYSKSRYNLSESKSIFPIVSPNNGKIIGVVEGDPDGSGMQSYGEYPLFVIWGGVRYNAISWGITTSKIEACENCLGWELFHQFLDWASDEDNMGFSIETDKEVYYSGDRILITAKAEVDIKEIEGEIIYPINDQSFDLVFSGGGKEWTSIYLIEEDPPGEYIISVTGDTLDVRKNVTIKVMDMYLDIRNNTEEVRISTELRDRHGQIIEGNVEIVVERPSGTYDQYSFDESVVDMIYNVSESGSYIVSITGTDMNNRSQRITENFYFKLKPNLTFVPENIVETVNNPAKLIKNIRLANEGKETVQGINVKTGGEISDWVVFNISPFNLTPQNYTSFNVNIDVPEVVEGEYKGILNISSKEGYDILPIIITVDYLGQLGVSPLTATEWLKLNDAKEVEFELKNSGKGSLEIISVNPSSEIQDWVHISHKPRIIPSNGKGILRVLVSTEGVSLTESLKRLSGKIDITTDLGVHKMPPSLNLNIFPSISEEIRGLYDDLIQAEKELEALKEEMDISNLQGEVEVLRIKIGNTQELYINNQLESAYQSYSSIQSEINQLKEQIQQKKEGIETRKKRNKIIIIGLIVFALVAIIGYIIYKKVKEEKRYSWLYKKWKPDLPF
jgi:hypothetical protein